MQEVKNTAELPEKFLERMERMLGAEYPAFLASYEEERAQGLRVNTLKLSREEFLALSPFSLSPVEWCDTGFYYASKERPGKHPYHEAGLYYIQEPSAMAVTELLMPQPGERVLDLCAAPGGKTSHIAAKLQGSGFLLSNEIHPQRARILSQNVERMGIGNAVVTNETPARLAARFPGFFDRIVVDAPCSGEGMFRKDENARAEWSPEQVALCAERQLEILDEADRLLRPGGIMVYSTCTFAPEENEGTLESFLAAHREYHMVERQVPAGFVRAGLPGAYRLFPHRLRGEGHFAAVLQKGSGGTGTGLPPARALADKRALADYESFKGELGLQLEGENYLLFGEQLYLVPREMTDMQGLRVVRPGLHLGTMKKNRFEPSHGLALFLQEGQVSSCISLSVESGTARAWLRGESLRLSDLSAALLNGWSLVTLGRFPLGWGKVSNGVLKNHYPKGLRWS